MNTVTLTPRDFSEFFRSIYSYDPFPWQVRLAEEVLTNRSWPEVIDLPTGTGKTAVIDIAVFALAIAPSVFPRRIVFVVDRRIIVDQVYKRATQILDALAGGENPVLQEVRDQLSKLSGDDEPIGVSSLRGGIVVDNEWMHSPEKPWIVVSTVDQFGSRLLFRGYGVSNKMRPIHAGLAGNDCLVILDEVHLSRPFAETLRQVSELECGPLNRRFTVVEMSATPNLNKARRFQLDPIEDQRECEEIRRRITAKKFAQLVNVPTRDNIPEKAKEIVKEAVIQGGNIAKDNFSIGIVVNRIKTARLTYKLLLASNYDVYMLTGRMRPLDRIQTLEHLEHRLDPDKNRDEEKLTIVVATQCIEVGADFSFDALITECAPVDCLKQRFGRLDRRGAYTEFFGTPAKAWILYHKAEYSKKKADPIYGFAVKKTWEMLSTRSNGNNQIDVGPLSNDLSNFPENTLAPSKTAPLLMKSYMDAWVQTNPEPIVQPDIDWFLHGIDIDQESTPDVSIVWRWDITEHALRHVPLRKSEYLSVPINAIKSWLSNSPETEVSDVATKADISDKNSKELQRKFDLARWNGLGKPVDFEVEDINPGDILLVSPERGGISAGCWDPTSTQPVDDLGDVAQIAYGRGVSLRLDDRLPYIESPPKPSDELDSIKSLNERLQDWMERTFFSDDLNKVIEILRKGHIVRCVDKNGKDNAGYYILLEKNQKTGNSIIDATMIDGTDVTASFTGSGVSLDVHLDGVGTRAAEYASRLCLPQNIVDDLELTGRLHDLGKVHSKFQSQLVGGDPVHLAMLDKPLAKSLKSVPKLSIYPRGMRHEIGSVAMIQSNRSILASANDEDLVLHLIGSHHGFSRPLPKIVTDPNPETLKYSVDAHNFSCSSDLSNSALALEMADRFWNLVDRYGYYGLAWLEAILRLADHRQSEYEAMHL